MSGGADLYEILRVRVSSSVSGPDAEDWVRVLATMYHRWADQHGLDPYTLQASGTYREVIMATADAADLRSILAGEQGVHRLVRISPFDEQHRRQTTFAYVHLGADPSSGGVRSYVLDPYTSVWDMDTDRRTDDAAGVLNGDLSLFVPCTLPAVSP